MGKPGPVNSVSDEDVLRALRDAYTAADREWGVTDEEVAAHLPVTPTTARDNLADLLDDGRIEASYIPIDTHPRRVYRPPEA